jgi:hypothetical protein
MHCANPFSKLKALTKLGLRYWAAASITHYNVKFTISNYQYKYYDSLSGRTH